MVRLLLVYDVDNWTWHRRAQDLQAYAPDQYDVTIASRQDYERDYGPTFQKLAEFDAVFLFSWTSHALGTLAHCRRTVTLVTCHGLEYEAPRADWYPSWATTPSRRRSRAAERLPHFDAVIAVNSRLKEAVDDCAGHTPIHLIPSGINTDIFTPGPQRTDGPLHVGWCAQTRGTNSVKGYKEVLRPLMKRLDDLDIEWVINDRDYRNALDRAAMVKWYHGLDALICTSICEGTPSPVFEAAACERLVLSTDVGMVGDWSLAHELDLVAPAYRNRDEAAATIGWFEDRLRWLASHRAEASDYGAELRRGLMGWCDYATVAPRYLDAIVGEGA